MEPSELHAYVIEVELQPDKVDEAIAIYRDSLVPAARDQEGYRGSRLLVDRAKNRALAVTYWDALCIAGFFQDQMQAVQNAIVVGKSDSGQYEIAVDDAM